MTPRTQSQQIAVQKVNISVQVVLQIVVPHKTKVTNKSRHLFCVLLFMAIMRCPSLVGIPRLGHVNIMSVLEAPWVLTLKRLVIFSVFKQRSQKPQ